MLASYNLEKRQALKVVVPKTPRKLNVSKEFKQLLPEFYEYIANLLGCSHAPNFDCRKLLISKTVQNRLYENYRREFEHEKDDYAFNSQITSMLLLYGPKVSNSLGDFEVLVERGFIN